MAKDFNRVVVAKYLRHKLSKNGHAWRFEWEDQVQEDQDEDGPLVPPTLAHRCRDSSTGGPDTVVDPRRTRVSVHRVLREAGEELERRYRADFTEMSRRLYLTSSTAQRRFADVIDELFRDGVNWGRMIAFFEFGGTVCVECASKGDMMTSQVDHIAAWMTEYLNAPRLNSWILDNGGWDAFVDLYDRQGDSAINCSWPSIKTVFGLAALGAASLTIGAYLTQK